MQSTTNFRGPFQNPSHSDTIKYLQLIWKNEKLCKDLLPYEDEFLSQLINVIEQKEKEIKNKKHNFDQETLDFMELDLQRVKYFIKDYLRIRLAKIEKYLYYILKNNLASLLSETEAKFVVDLINMKAVYFNEGLKKVVAVANNFRPFYDKYKNSNIVSCDVKIKSEKDLILGNYYNIKIKKALTNDLIGEIV